MRVLVLGHRGMLGHVVARYFQEQHITPLTLDCRFAPDSSTDFIRHIVELKPDWCINCVGIGPGRGSTAGQMHAANVLLPESLSVLAQNIKVLHASTDGVFSPEKPAREIHEPPDATDEYGAGKAAAEKSLIAAGAIVIRSSIIGPERGTPKSLLSWALAQKGPLTGFTNQMWNGITTLEWARLAFSIVSADQLAFTSDPIRRSDPGDARPSSPSPPRVAGGEGRGEEPPTSLCQPGFLPPISKYDLLRLILDEWQTGASISPAEGKHPVSRWLVPNVPIPPIKNQLNDLRRWY